MTLDTSDQRLNADVSVGSTTTLTLVVTNTGTAPLNTVNLTSTPPSGWKVTFDTTSIATIPADSSQPVNVPVQIEPASNAVAGDYVITINARTTEASDSISIRATVQTSPIGGLLGIAVLVLVAIGLFFVFQFYGRR
jgi:uncharacterized repeat protein (TIGR01451 family)